MNKSISRWFDSHALCRANGVGEQLIKLPIATNKLGKKVMLAAQQIPSVLAPFVSRMGRRRDVPWQTGPELIQQVWYLMGWNVL